MTADISSDLKNWSSTAASNQPDYSDVLGPNNLADNLRVLQKVIRDNASHIQGAYSFATYYSGTTLDISTIPEQHIFFAGAPTGNITSLGAIPSSGTVKHIYFSYSEGSGAQGGGQATAFSFQSTATFYINKVTSGGKVFIWNATRYTFVSNGTNWELTEVFPLATVSFSSTYTSSGLSTLMGSDYANSNPFSILYKYVVGRLTVSIAGTSGAATVRPGQLILVEGAITTTASTLTVANGTLYLPATGSFSMLLFGAGQASSDGTATVTATCLCYSNSLYSAPGVSNISGQVTFSGGVPTLSTGSKGISSITDSGTGITTINGPTLGKLTYAAITAGIDGTAGTSTCNCVSNYGTAAASHVVYTFTSGVAADLNFCIEGSGRGQQ